MHVFLCVFIVPTSVPWFESKNKNVKDGCNLHLNFGGLDVQPSENDNVKHSQSH